MLTRVFLAAGVAALAIAAPASAERGGKGGDKAERAQVAKQDGRGQRAQRVERAPRIERAQQVQRVERFSMPRAERSQRFAAIERRERPARAEARTERRAERQNRIERVERANRVERRAARVERPARIERAERVADRQQVRSNRVERVQDRMAVRDQLRANRIERVQNRIVLRDQFRDERRITAQELRTRLSSGFGVGVGGCPPGLAKKPVECVPPGQVGKSGFLALTGDGRTRILAPSQAAMLLGVPLTTAASVVSLAPLPQNVQFLYPDTSDSFFRFGNGYLYEVDRDSSLIAALIPLLAGGFMPGQYLPASYMNSFVPNYYGFNSFYPDFDDDCYRYGNGVIYEVDCFTGLIEDVIPLYAGGYGFGQMLPSAYSYYNVPLQYRSLYYNTPDYNYWYAPGAIYQVDPTTSLITSIASLLTPGFSVGQPLPMGYSMYNVPMGYRGTYYDTPSSWYRYNNGYIYQVDPTTMLVTAIVASILT